jgi:hypothetical protein
MDPLTIAALIAAATSAVQGIAGGIQLNRAKKLEEQNKRPTATMDPMIVRLINYAKARTYDQDVPAGNIYRNEIKGATAAGVQAASEINRGSEGMGAMVKMVLGEQNAFSQQAKTVAEQLMENRNKYMGVLAGPGYEESRRVDYWNKEMPYLQAAVTATRLRESGSRNLVSSIKNIGGVASEAAAPDLYSSLFSNNKNYYGKGEPFTADQLQQIIDGLTKK